jgi:hypothetical protein
MTRRLLRFAVLGHVLLGFACSDGEVEPTVSDAFEPRLDLPATTRCPDGDSGYSRDLHLVAVDRPFTFRLHLQKVTQSCRCKYTTTSQWAWTHTKHCESEYDLGSPNPQVCDTLSVEPVEITSGSVASPT